jgi:hypothetical protein
MSISFPQSSMHYAHRSTPRKPLAFGQHYGSYRGPSSSNFLGIPSKFLNLENISRVLIPIFLIGYGIFSHQESKEKSRLMHQVVDVMKVVQNDCAEEAKTQKKWNYGLGFGVLTTFVMSARALFRTPQFEEILGKGSLETAAGEKVSYKKPTKASE